jgi:hypothetical protein
MMWRMTVERGKRQDSFGQDEGGLLGTLVVQRGEFHRMGERSGGRKPLQP